MCTATLGRRWSGRWGIAILSLLGAAFAGDRSNAGTIAVSSPAYRVDIANNLVWYDSFGTITGQQTAPRLSVLQRLRLQSQPQMRVTNVSTAGDMLVRLQLDLGNSVARITDTTWLAGTGRKSWTWDEANRSAFFDFLDPIRPGESVVMKLTTGPQADRSAGYRLNQTLFHPVLGVGTDANSSYATLRFFSQTAVASQAPVSTLDLGVSPLVSGQLDAPGAGVTQLVAVPEPATAVLALGAIAVVVGGRLCRRR